MKTLNYFIPVVLFVIISQFYGCKSDLTRNEETASFYLSLRMEVHVVDSLYPAYSIPRTKTYLHTFRKSSGGAIYNEEYSDTTTCPNGWAVKELFYSLAEGDTVKLGATIKEPPAGNYQFANVGYNELIRFEGESDTIRFVKTFTIYQ